jgi:hypothetical protein
MRLRGVIVLLCLPVGLAGCGGDDVSRDNLVRAADATRDAGGAHIETHGVVSGGIDRAYRYTGAGFRDARGSTDITSHYTNGGNVRAIKIGDTNYFSYPGFDPGWDKVDFRSSGPNLLAGPDPKDPGAIARVFDLADVRRVGQEDVRGTATTHYAATIDIRDFVRLAAPQGASAIRDAYQRAIQQGGGGSLRVDLWVDDNDLITRIRQRLSTRLTGVDYPPDDQTMELFDFGLKKRVVPPPKRDTEAVAPERAP